MNGSDGLRWRKSTRSGANGGGCVEVTDHNGMIMVRDTMDHGRGPVHRYTPEAWRTFIAGVRNSEIGLDDSGRLP
jgi:predicted secreted Zn-dependent protease